MSLRRWLVSGFLVFFCAALYFGGPRIYLRIKAERLADVSAEAFRQGDETKAMAFAQRALEIHPSQAEAIRVLAYILLEERNPQALMWLARWVENDPRDPQRLFSLGNGALLLNDPATARVALAAVKKIPGASAEDVMALEAALLIHEQQPGRALDLYDAAAKNGDSSLSPRMRLNYASLLVSTGREGDRRKGLGLLASLVAVPEVRRAALRTRILHGLSRKERDLVFPGIDQLVAESGTPVRDVLLWGSACLQMGRELPDDYYARLELAVGNDAPSFSQAVGWIIANAQWQSGIQWTRALLEKRPADPYLCRSHAALLAAAGDWAGMRDWLAKSAWPESDPRRLIYELQSRRKTRAVATAYSDESLLNRLSSAFKKNPFALSTCDPIVAAWGWKEERVRFWDAVADSRPSLPASWLWGEIRRAQATKDTVRLYGFSRLLLIHQPEDPVLLNNGATYGLLLNHKVSHYADVAEKNLQKKPGDKILMTTLALALIRKNRPGEALALFENFSSEELNQPGFAAYYAMALRASGHSISAHDNARPAEQADLLPEERQLAGLPDLPGM